jgi:hypothetical protein
LLVCSKKLTFTLAYKNYDNMSNDDGNNDEISLEAMLEVYHLDEPRTMPEPTPQAVIQNPFWIRNFGDAKWRKVHECIV